MKFKCKHTGQLYEFLQENDIAEMMKHEEYSVVDETPKEEVKPKPKKEAK